MKVASASGIGTEYSVYVDENIDFRTRPMYDVFVSSGPAIGTLGSFATMRDALSEIGERIDREITAEIGESEIIDRDSDASPCTWSHADCIDAACVNCGEHFECTETFEAHFA
jgi:hypothetical protein